MTEDPAPQGQFVEHEEPQRPEPPCPALVVGKDHQMKHLGVREEHVRVLSHPQTFLGSAVAVVGGRDHLGKVPCPEREQLILCQRLGRVDQQ